MTRYIIRRVLLTIPVLFGVLILVFFLNRVLPGSQCRALLGERATDAQCAAYDHLHGLDQPIPVQFGTYVASIAQGDFGVSVKTSQPVTTLLIERLPVTVELSIVALLFAVIVGVTLGIISAYKRNSAIDVITMTGANVGVSIPIFVLGLLLAFVFAIMLKGTPIALPPSGRLTPGLTVIPLADAWGLQGLTGPPRVVLDFLSNMYTFNSLVTGKWNILADALRHLILPRAPARGDDRRDPAGQPARRSDPDRDDLQPVRGRASRDRGDHGPRLLGRGGVRARDRGRIPARQPPGRPVVRVPRPADPPVMRDVR